MLVRVVELSRQEEELDLQLKAVSKELEKAKYALSESMTQREVKSTARYEGIGWATLEKPELYARCNKEDQDKLFTFLKEVKREDLIVPSVHYTRLKSFVKELLNGAKPVVPDFIQYGFKSNLLLYDREK